MKLPNLKYVYVPGYIIEQVKGKSVLHLGCVGELDKLADCLHLKISGLAKVLYGIDSDPNAIKQIKHLLPEEGDRIKYFLGNVEQLSDLGINRNFQIIFVGAIIEHLSNPGEMLSALKRFLEPDGIVIFTTPNCFGLLQYLRVAFRRQEAVNPQHTCWFSISVLIELCSRYGLVPVLWRTGYDYRKPSWRVSVKRAIGILL